MTIVIGIWPEKNVKNNGYYLKEEQLIEKLDDKGVEYQKLHHTDKFKPFNAFPTYLILDDSDEIYDLIRNSVFQIKLSSSSDIDYKGDMKWLLKLIIKK